MGRRDEPNCPVCIQEQGYTDHPVYRLYKRMKDKGFVGVGWECAAGHMFCDDDAIDPHDWQRVRRIINAP